MKRFFLFMILILFLIGCAQPMDQDLTPAPPVKADVTITIVQEGDAVAVKATTPNGKIVRKGMEVKNPSMELSQISGISNGKLFLKIYSGLSVADVTRFWNDLIYLENETDIKDVQVFIDSPGGDAFSGLALADTIKKFQGRGFHFTAHATGIIASAAVPVFAVCDLRLATKSTIFMVHEAALWKWPGRETASDIRTQGKLMDLLQKLYLDIMVENSSDMSFQDWVNMEHATSWFGTTTTGDVKGALEIGILDAIE